MTYNGQIPSPYIAVFGIRNCHKSCYYQHNGACYRKALIPINIDKCPGYMAITNHQGTTIMRKERDKKL